MTLDQALAAAAIAVAIIFGIIQPYQGWSRRRREEAKKQPGAQVHINGSPSVDGWRSVQVHLTAPEVSSEPFDYRRSGWRVESATLLSPRNAQIAFARPDDHSLRGPVEALSKLRVMSGRMDDVQPHALEFFFRLPETPTHDHDKRLRFRVKIFRREPFVRRTVDLWGTVPLNAETSRHPAG